MSTRKSLNIHTLLACLCLASAWSTSAAVVTYTFDSGFADSGSIADGSATPWIDARTLGGIGGTITSVTVELDIAGGYNGDLYAYLSHDGTLVPLLNRVGVGSANTFGYGDAGLNVTFSDAAANNIHTYQTVSSYSISAAGLWQPDGRTISPLSDPTAFDAPGSVSLSSYVSLSPDGDWSLVLGDVSKGGGQATVLSWGLNITTTAVPEPSAKPFGLAGAALLVAQAVGFWRRNRRTTCLQAQPRE